MLMGGPKSNHLKHRKQQKATGNSTSRRAHPLWLSLTWILLWLLSNSRQYVSHQILLTHRTQDRSARMTLFLLRSASHDSITLACRTPLASGDALEAFSASLARRLRRSKKPPDSERVTRRRVVTPEAGWQLVCVRLWAEAWISYYHCRRTCRVVQELEIVTTGVETSPETVNDVFITLICQL